MRNHARFLRTALALGLAAASAAAPSHARPRATAPIAHKQTASPHLPNFSATDLDGHTRSPNERLGQRTLYVVVPGADAGPAAGRWLDSIGASDPAIQDAMVTVVALRLPFFVPDGIVLDRARGNTPAARWNHTWLNRDGRVQDALGVHDGGAVPYVFVVDEHGGVMLQMRANPDPAAVQSAVTLLHGAPR